MEKRTLKKTSWIFAAGIALLLSTIILTPISSQAQTNRYWIGGNEEYGYQMWYIPENWQDDYGNPGMPLSGDYAYVGTSDTPGAQVAYNHWYSSGNLNYLRIDNESTLFYVGFGRLPVLNTDVGYDSTGTFQLGWGSHDVQGSLVLGVNFGSTGIYEISSGALNVGLNTIVGNEGIGTFTQSDGTATVNGNLYLGNNWGSEGTYNLSGDPATSILTVGGSTIVGNLGTGTFNQSGGTHTIDGGLVLGQWFGSSGTYNLSGTGYLSMVGDMYIGVEGTGSFTQNDSSIVVANNIFLGTSGGSGSYELKGGNLSLTGVGNIGYSGIGTFTQTGGTHTIAGDLILGDQAGSSGTYNLSGDPSLVTLSVGGNTIVGNWGTGTFTQSGGTHTISGDLYLGYNRDDSDPLNPIISNGTYSLSGDSSVSLWVGGNELIGWGGTGAFTQTGGTHTVMGDLNLGQGEGTTGTFALSNGDLNIDGSLNIGHDGIGIFTQNSGTNKVGYNLVLGNNPTGDGTYTMEDGSLSTYQVFVGLAGKGTFTQNGGTHSISGQLAVAHWGSGGTYNLNGGTLNAGFTQVGITGGLDYPGVFNQTGGEHITNGLWMANGCGGNEITGWCTPGSYAYYNLSGGSLTVNGEARIGLGGYAEFNQTGGSATFDSLVVGGGASLPGVTPATQGIVNLTDGKLDVTGDAIVGAGDPFYWEFNKDNSLPLYGGMGTINQTGGKISVGGNLILGQAGGNVSGTGSYNLFGTGNLQVTGSTIVGEGGTGTFTQTGGTHTVTGGYGALVLGGSSIGKGTYNLDSGKLDVTCEEYIGESGKGYFYQKSGTHTLNGAMYVGLQTGSYGEYHISGGTLTATDHITLGSGSGSSGIFNLSNTGDVNAGYVHVGRFGIGVFNQSGGKLTTDTLTIAVNPGSTGTYNMSGGTLNAVGGIVNNGTFNFTGGDVITSLLQNYGLFKGGGNSFSGSVANYGTVSPGLSPGTLNITGDYTQDISGILLIELAGYTQGTEYDFLNITGKATLGGTLDIDLLPGFDPIMGSIFNILHADQGRSGMFAFLDLPALGGGRGWEINYGLNDVTVHVTPVPSTLLLLGSGLIGIVGLMRRKLKK